MTDTKRKTAEHAVVNIAVPASEYTYKELADIYNQTRIDYIVPMPMNAKRMEEYVQFYDVSLDASVVATKEDGEPIAVGMLGLRDDRAWITRLGVVPVHRERRLGSFLMTELINGARRFGADRVQLEVIVGNKPARRMFLKFGFQEVRELYVARRPPGPPSPLNRPRGYAITHLSDTEIRACLASRPGTPSWVEDTPSLLTAGRLRGIRVETQDRRRGWVIFHHTPFQIQHVTLSTNHPDDVDLAYALIYSIHQLYPSHDTKTENIPKTDPCWESFERNGYVVAFRRTEMTLDL